MVLLERLQLLIGCFLGIARAQEVRERSTMTFRLGLRRLDVALFDKGRARHVTTFRLRLRLFGHLFDDLVDERSATRIADRWDALKRRRVRSAGLRPLGLGKRDRRRRRNVRNDLERLTHDCARMKDQDELWDTDTGYTCSHSPSPL